MQRLRRFFGHKRTLPTPPRPKTPTPPRPTPNLPRNMLLEIAKNTNARTKRIMSRVMSGYTRKTIPVGLSVTKVGRSMVPRNQFMVNRSRATAKAHVLKSSTNLVDRVNPSAYKNDSWKFYSLVGRHSMYFKNTPNGRPFFITNSGARKNAQAVDFPIQYQPRKFPFHTWTEYTKRAMRDQRIKGGQSVRNTKRTHLNINAKKFVNGNNRALNKYTIPELIYWANPKYASNGPPYVKRGGKWERYGGLPVNKQNILNNIRMYGNMMN